MWSNELNNQEQINVVFLNKVLRKVSILKGHI